jgi:molybdate/tungstate transport system substrate-binding protein
MFLWENKNESFAKAMIKHRKVKWLILLLLFFYACQNQQKEPLIIFHAGSLSPLMMDVEKNLPTVSFQTEASGSVEALRKAISLNKKCDILMLSDVGLVDSLPQEKIKACYIFASNELVLAYNKKKFPFLSSNNLCSTLVNNRAKLGRSDPCLDPCGYRALMALNVLAQKDTNARKLILASKPFVRPKETDLNTFFELGELDAFFTYRNIAEKHNYPYIELPDSINFSNKNLENFYRNTCMDVEECNKKVCGRCIAYVLVVLNDSSKKNELKEFISFLESDKGQTLIRKNGFIPTWEMCKK